jgi:phenylalanyl-tRNA synthetase beta chain
MKAPLSWLQQFVPELPTADAGAQQIADALTLGGLPVEHIESLPNGDRVLDVEVTSNRADCLSIVGVAREVAALLGLKFNPPDIKPPASKPVTKPGDAGVAVSIHSTELCPYYSARVIRGVSIAASPGWLVDRLAAVGVRSINNVVDVTNYVLFELGQPLHAFDLTHLSGQRINVRPASQGETLVTLDGKEQKLAPSMLVIADDTKPVALAGVMGGETSGVTFRSTDILLESARFDPMSIRKTARSLAMASDSSYRFERGLDPTLAKRASDRACELILQTAGGTVVGSLVEAGSDALEPNRLTLRMASLRKLLGVDWSVADAVEALKRLGFSPTPRGDEIDVIAPTHRLDIRIETDLIEEVARVVGYEHIPTRDRVAVRLTQREPARVATSLIGQTLNALGYFEALTFSFVSDTLAEPFRHAEAAKLHKVESATRRVDAQLRPSILPNLLESVARNENVGVAGAKLFETASTFWLDAEGKSVERRALGIVGSTDYAELRGAVETVLKRLDARRPIQVSPTSRAGFGANACGEVKWADQSIGYIGKTDRAIAERLGLTDLPAIAELWLEPLIAGHSAVPQLQPLPSFPAVRRDLSLLLTDAVRYEQIEQLVHELKLDALEAMEFVTTYRGKPLEKGTKSVTFTLAFRKPDGTLTSAEVDERVSKVIELAKTRVGATLRA